MEHRTRIKNEVCDNLSIKEENEHKEESRQKPINPNAGYVILIDGRSEVINVNN